MGDKCGCCLCFSIFKVTLVEHCIKENMPSRAENKVNNIAASTTGVNVPCFLCQKPSTEQCTQCKLVYFCSKEHYHLHRITLRQEVSSHSTVRRAMCVASHTSRLSSRHKMRFLKPAYMILFKNRVTTQKIQNKK